MFRIVTWAGIALLGAAIVVTAISRHWGGVATLSVFFFGAVAMARYDRHLPSAFHALVVLAFMIDAAGFVWDLFGWWMYDELAHGYTTLAIALSAGFILYSSMKRSWRDHPLLLAICIASFGLAVGGAWEVVEYATGIISDMRDTIFDLVCDALGAAIAGGLAAWWVQHGPVQPLRPSRRERKAYARGSTSAAGARV